jgi:hypothetical protein
VRQFGLEGGNNARYTKADSIAYSGSPLQKDNRTRVYKGCLSTPTKCAFLTQVKRSVECRDVVAGCKSLEGIAQHYTLPWVELTGVVLDPSLPVAA